MSQITGVKEIFVKNSNGKLIIVNLSTYNIIF